MPNIETKPAPVAIDPASLTVPVKALAFGPALFAIGSILPDGSSPEWSGAWAFPAKPAWSDEDRAAWVAVNGQKIHETKQLEAAVAAVDAATLGPAAMLAAARIEVGEVQRAREAAERRAKGEAAWLKAREQLGDGCARVEGEEGDVFILRRMKDIEITVAEHKATITSAPHEKDNPVRAATERAGARRDALVACVCHPDRERVIAMLDEYPLLVGALYGARDSLILGWRVEQGKGSAP